MSGEPILDVRDLRISFPARDNPVEVVAGASFAVHDGEAVGIVGESGSGKSMTALSLLHMVPSPGIITAQRLVYAGEDILGMRPDTLRQLRGGGIGMIFQDPLSSLNPAMQVGDQIEEAMLAHGRFGRQEARDRAGELLERVGIPDARARLRDHPHQFSGGMRQRVMIAMALANRPRVLVADEPTTALDVTIQAQILDLLAEVNNTGTSILLITHNLGVVARVCRRVIVMYAGTVVEEGPVDRLFTDPRHPYTWGLLRSVPRLRGRQERLESIEGRPLEPAARPRGCPFVDRCALATDRCHQERPPLTAIGPGHFAACWVTTTGEAVAPAPSPPSHPSAGPPRSGPPLLELESVATTFSRRARTGLRSRRQLVHAVDGVNLSIRPGETLGLVGESGCGKSTLGLTIMRAYEPAAGRIRLRGQDVTPARGRALRRFRREVQMVFQDPYASLNPRMTVGEIVAEPLVVHGLVADRNERRTRVGELLELVGLDPAMVDRYPHEFSGGQRQRIGIARALAVEPSLIVCDEPVSALDVSVQAQVVNLLRDLQARLGLAYLFIAHDLAVVRHVSHRVAVMYLGKIVELADSDELCDRPLHPYTVSLLAAAPEPDPASGQDGPTAILAGDLPSPLRPPRACRFHTRCPIGPAFRPDRTICAETEPALVEQRPGHHVACHFAGELTTAVEARQLSSPA